MLVLILINGMLETLAGLGMLFTTTKIPGLRSAGDQALLMARMYGAAALSVGIFSFLVYKQIDNTDLVKVFVQSMCVFHTSVSLVNVFAATAGNKNALPVAILHAVFAIAFILALIFGGL